MENRSTEVKSLRPDLDLIKDLSAGNEVNLFQTEVLRPILKFQNDVIVDFFKSSTKVYTDKVQIEAIVTSTLSKDQRVKGVMLGMVLGMLTVEEMRFYNDHQKEISKRITAMLKQRLISQL